MADDDATNWMKPSDMRKQRETEKASVSAGVSSAKITMKKKNDSDDDGWGKEADDWEDNSDLPEKQKKPEARKAAGSVSTASATATPPALVKQPSATSVKETAEASKPSPAVREKTASVSSNPFKQKDGASASASSSPAPISKSSTPVKSTPSSSSLPATAASPTSSPFKSAPSARSMVASSSVEKAPKKIQDVPISLKSKFSSDELTELISLFKEIDVDHNDTVDVNELMTLIRKLGMKASSAEVERLIYEIDDDNSKCMDIAEFLELIDRLKRGKVSSMNKDLAIGLTKGLNVVKVVGTAGSTHAYSEEEKSYYVNYINGIFGSDNDVKHLLPIHLEGDSLFNAVGDGILLCKLVLNADSSAIDRRVIAIDSARKGKRMNIVENLNLAINSARAIGCQIVNTRANDIMEGKEHIILGFLWQVVRAALLSNICLQSHPQLLRLLEDGEDLEKLLKLPPEKLLVRWVNFHLRAANSPRQIKGFTDDMKDAEVYTILMNQIAPSHCDLTPLNEKDTFKRAERVLANASKMGIRSFIKPGDITKGNHKLNLAFVADLFNNYPALDPLTQEEAKVISATDFAEQMDFNSEGSREERVFRLWLNSMDLDPLIVNDLFSDLKDGQALLSVLEKITPGTVDWKRVVKNPPTYFTQVQNTNYVIEICKKMGMSMPGVQGKDVSDGNKKLTLGIVWQLMRHHIVSLLSELGGSKGQPVADSDILKWANATVKSTGSSRQINKFGDGSLSDGLYLLDLLKGAFGNVVDPAVTCQSPSSDEDKRNNASYVISIARKCGCPVLLVPDDIFEVKQKMLLTFVGLVMHEATIGKK